MSFNLVHAMAYWCESRREGVHANNIPCMADAVIVRLLNPHRKQWAEARMDSLDAEKTLGLGDSRKPTFGVLRPV